MCNYGVYFFLCHQGNNLQGSNNPFLPQVGVGVSTSSSISAALPSQAGASEAASYVNGAQSVLTNLATGQIQLQAIPQSPSVTMAPTQTSAQPLSPTLETTQVRNTADDVKQKYDSYFRIMVYTYQFWKRTVIYEIIFYVQMLKLFWV